MPSVPRAARGRALQRGARRRRRRPRRPGSGDLHRSGTRHGPGMEERIPGGPDRGDGTGRSASGELLGARAPCGRGLGRAARGPSRGSSRVRSRPLHHPGSPGSARRSSAFQAGPPAARPAGGGAPGRRRRPGHRRAVGSSGADGQLAPAPHPERGPAASPGWRGAPGRALVASTAGKSCRGPSSSDPRRRSAGPPGRRRRHHRGHPGGLRPGAGGGRRPGAGRPGPGRGPASGARIRHGSGQNHQPEPAATAGTVPTGHQQDPADCSGAGGATTITIEPPLKPPSTSAASPPFHRFVRLRRSRGFSRSRHARKGGVNSPIWCTLCGTTHRRFPPSTRTVRRVPVSVREGPSRGDRR